MKNYLLGILGADWRLASLNTDPVLSNKTAPAKKLPYYLPWFRKAPALAISGALILCLGIVYFSWLIAQKSAEGLGRQSAPEFVVVTLSPSSTRASGTLLLTVPTGGAGVKLELELTNASFHIYKSPLFRESEALDTRDGLRMEVKGDHHVVPESFFGSEIFSETFTGKSHIH